jgi:hypothetical protein
VLEPNTFSSDFEQIPDPLGQRSAAPAPAPPLRTRAFRNRDEARRGFRLALLLGAGWIAGQLAITGIRSDMASVPLGYQLACGVAPFVSGLSCLVAALSPGRLGLGARVTLLAALALALPLTFTLSNYALAPPYAEAPLGSFKHGVFCFNVAIAWTLLPLIAAGIALRSSFVSRAVWRSALVGLGAGLIVATTSMLRCPLSGAWHMALSHGGAVVASALLGALVLSRVTRV